jgi:AraC-like DNA-binding protein
VARAESSSIVRLSTRAVAPADRLGYASWILNSSLAPSVLSTATPAEYDLEVTALELPSIGIVAASGSQTRSIRGPSEIRRTSQRYFSLALVLRGTANFTSVTRNRFAPGDLIFYDSRNPQDCELLSHWSTLVLQLSEQFVRKWVPNPAVLGWRRICPESQWGRVLASYVAQLAPEFVVHAPLPQALLIDQLGALLALTAAELSGSRVASTPIERTLRDQVRDHLTQRCPDASLHAADVANSLDISTRTLHRTLAAGGETFGSMLIQARVDLAVRMLQSPLFDRMTTAEIGRRAGFSDASHFVRVLRRHTGQSPLRMRRARLG